MPIWKRLFFNDSSDCRPLIKVIVHTAMEYLREDTEETNKNSCEAKETPELEAKKTNEGTELPDMTTMTSHLSEDYMNQEVMTACQAVQKKENDGIMAKLKVFGEKSTKKIFFQLTFHCHERQIISIS